MNHIEIIEEPFYSAQLDALCVQYPRVREIHDDATWKVSRGHEKFPVAANHGTEIEIRIFRTDESLIPALPVIEIAYYYSLADGCIHFIGIRPIAESVEAD